MNPGDTVLLAGRHTAHVVDHPVKILPATVRTRCGLYGLLAADQSHACLAGRCKACRTQQPAHKGEPCQ